MTAFIVVCSTRIALAEELSPRDRAHYAEISEAHIYKNESGKTMLYRLFVPRDYDPKLRYPLLLSFHGAGSRGSDNLKHLRPWVAGWTADEVQKKHPCIILMPQCPAGQQWVNTPWTKGSYSFSKIPISSPMTLAKEIFDKILKEKSIDRSRIYVMGASMGGYATWNFVMRYPDLVAAAVPICGAADPAMAESIKSIPIWAFHGDIDDVVPPAGSKDMISAIKKAGGNKAQLTMYIAVKHTSYVKAWKEPDLIDWVFKQKRMDNKPDPSNGK